MSDVEVKVPDLGDFADVPVIELIVSPGDEVQVESPLIVLESDKATMEVPSTAAGTVKELKVAVGDTVSTGHVIAVVEGAGDGPAGPVAGGRPPTALTAPEGSSHPRHPPDETPSGTASTSTSSGNERDFEVLVLGGGPGGYTAAFRAADLGLKTVLVERYERLGGVCLNVGCIPSKALLHIAQVLNETRELSDRGIRFDEPEIDIERLRGWKDSVVERLTGGLTGLARKRKVEVVTGRGRFTGPNEVEVETADGSRKISFENAIVATGSSSVALPGLPEDERIVDSTGALEVPDVPERLLVIGGGIIGLEMATVYDALGSKVTVVELLDTLIPGCDADLVRPLQKRIATRYEGIHTGVKVAGIEAAKNGLSVTFEGEGAPEGTEFDLVLVAVGRRPNGGDIGADAAGLKVDERGFIAVDERMRTNVAHIHAIGDVVGQPMLAHKATHEGKVAAEVIAGHDVVFDPRTIPSVAYTDPEVAWMGLTETDAKRDGVTYEKASFPWAASGRALSLGRDEGTTKILVDPESRRVLGAGIVGVNAGELIAETVHALEMGSNAEDVGLTIHPHPTLSETVGFAAEAVEGTITDIYIPRRKGK